MSFFIGLKRKYTEEADEPEHQRVRAKRRQTTCKQPRHIHHIEFCPSSAYIKHISKKELFDELTDSVFTVEEYDICIVAQEAFEQTDVVPLDPRYMPYKLRILLKMQTKYTTEDMRVAIKDVIERVQGEPLKESIELEVSGANDLKDAVASITKIDMDFLSFSEPYVRDMFNFRFKIFSWCKLNAHLALEDPIVQQYIESNKPFGKKFVTETFKKAVVTRNQTIERQQELTEPLPNELRNITSPPPNESTESNNEEENTNEQHVINVINEQHIIDETLVEQLEENNITYDAAPNDETNLPQTFEPTNEPSVGTFITFTSTELASNFQIVYEPEQENNTMNNLLNNNLNNIEILNQEESLENVNIDNELEINLDLSGFLPQLDTFDIFNLF